MSADVTPSAEPQHERLPQDAYPTPQPLADAICRRIRDTVGDFDLVIEPSAGRGPFVRAARTTWPEAMVMAIEIDEECRPALVEAGAHDVFIGRWEDWAETVEPGTKVLILGNPPFSEAENHVELALRRLEAWGGADKWLAFLLRGAFITTQARVDRFFGPQGIGGLRFVQHLRERPSFINGASDNSEYACFKWEAGFRGAYQGSWLSWR